MNLFDLVRAKDQSLSQTKLAAACFHFSIFVTVGYLTWIKKEFLVDMWALYAAVAVGHSIVDKSAAQIKDFKETKLNIENAPVSVTKTETTTTSTEPAIGN